MSPLAFSSALSLCSKQHSFQIHCLAEVDQALCLTLLCAARSSCVTVVWWLLCRLYVNVITTIRSFGDYFWVDVVEQIDAMTEQVSSQHCL